MNDGRFTQADPLRFNRPFKGYLYVRNRPVSFIDPLGLEDTPESKARMLRHFKLWYGRGGMVLLNAFLESGGRLRLTDLWFGRKKRVGIREITIDMDDEGEAADNLMEGLLEGIGELGVEQKLKVAEALGLESASSLNLATVRSLARETGKVLDTAEVAAGIASTGAALALGVDQLAEGDYLGAAFTFAGTRVVRGGGGGAKGAGGSAAGSAAAGAAAPSVRAVQGTGQLHHAISRKIHEALEEHEKLRGIYQARDPRFVLRAADETAHRGYQTWHRQVDEEVVKWVRKTKSASPADFQKYLREIYERPEMVQRFPWGFER